MNGKGFHAEGKYTSKGVFKPPDAHGTQLYQNWSRCLKELSLYRSIRILRDERCLPQRRRSGPESQGANFRDDLKLRGALEVPQKCGKGGGQAFKTEKQEQVI